MICCLEDQTYKNTSMVSSPCLKKTPKQLKDQSQGTFKVLAFSGTKHAAGFNRVKVLLWRGNTWVMNE